MKKWLLIIAAIGLLGFVLFKYVFVRYPCLPPDRPKPVPEVAIWKGGCDGGHWIELVSIEKEKVRLRIYRDWNGDLILDADFKYNNCDTFRLTESIWIECGGDFINGSIGVHINCNKDLECQLEPIYPAYEEEKLE